MTDSVRAAIFLAVIGSAGSALAQAPVAVVEDIQGKPAGVELMDYVTPGQKIVLGVSDSIVLGYVKSCWRESITGGAVTVGAEQSTVEGGKVERTKVGCDGGKISLAPPQANKAGGMVFRDAPATRPQFVLYGSSPLIEAKGGGTLVIERTDQRGERHEVTIASGAWAAPNACQRRAVRMSSERPRRRSSAGDAAMRPITIAIRAAAAALRREMPAMAAVPGSALSSPARSGSSGR